MGRRDDSGAVTAELAMALPVLLALTAVLAWMLGVGAAQIRVVDASREAARVLARGDDPARARELALRIAPARATVAITYHGSDVVVETSAQVRPPGRLLGSLGGVTVRSTALAAREQVPAGQVAR
jgi:Flp pilus assembly protein TadG